MQLPEKYRSQSASLLKYWQENPAICSDQSSWNNHRLSYQHACINPQNNQLQNIETHIQKIPNRQRGICTIVVIALLLIILMFLLIDVKHEFEAQIIKNEKKKQVCYQQYMENQCAIPLDALIQKCKDLEECANIDSKKAVRISQKFAKVLGSFIKVLCQHLSALGVLLILTFILIFMHYSTKKEDPLQKIK